MFHYEYQKTDSYLIEILNGKIGDYVRRVALFYFLFAVQDNYQKMRLCSTEDYNNSFFSC
jgi:hypothetical protein